MQNTPTCDVPTSKRQTKNKKMFFSMSTKGLAESVQGLNSSLALAVGDIWPKKGAPIYWLARSLNVAIFRSASDSRVIALFQ